MEATLEVKAGKGWHHEALQPGIEGVESALKVSGGAARFVLGGVLTTKISWRWVLSVNVPLGLMAALTATFSRSARALETRSSRRLPWAKARLMGLQAKAIEEDWP